MLYAFYVFDGPRFFDFLETIEKRPGREELDDAEKMYKRALEIDPEHAMATCRLARLYQDKAARSMTRPWLAKPEEVRAHMARALDLYDRASQITKADQELSYIYYEWAICLAIQKDFRGAWQKIHLSKQHGSEYIQKDFIEKLSKDLPDPFAGEGRS